MIASEDFFNKLEKQIRDKLPAVAYRKPAAAGVTKGLFQKDAEVYTTSGLNESGFVFAPFQSSEERFLIPQEFSEELLTEYKETTTESDFNQELEFPPEKFNKKEKIEHEQLVQSAIDEIKNGSFKKVVVARKERVSTQLSAITIFKKLLKKYEDAFVYLWFHPKTGIWLGATPEVLLKTERNRLKTMALAGTQTYRGSTNVSWGAKEVEEQQLVTNYILKNLRNVLEPETKIEKSEAYTSRAGNLLHIKTDISAVLGDMENLKEVISALHPTPAVCGLPKKEALQFILQNEHYNREYYTGFLGELNFKTEMKRKFNRRNQENQQFSAITKTSNLMVNLRCMKLEEGKAEIFVGGGITEDSNPADEWTETVNKAQTIKSVLFK